jgi:NADH dehydrogenase
LRPYHLPVPSRPRVVVVGAGFGGLEATKRLAQLRLVDVLLLDRHNYHLFQPLLYQVATAGLEAEAIAYPVRRIVHHLDHVEFRLANVAAVDLAQRELRTDGGIIRYDFLVLAAGSQTNFFGMQELASHAIGLKGLADAEALRNHVLSCFERAAALAPGDERKALLTFVIAGGGPTGVELAGAMAELLDLVVRHDYRGLVPKDEPRLVLVEGGPDLLAMVHPRLRRAAERALRRKGVDVLLSTQVKGYDGQTVALATRDPIAARTLAWATGVRAAGLADATGLAQARGARLAVEPTLRLPGQAEAYAIGDIAYLEQDGRPLPQLAPVAIQQAACAAENIARTLQGLQPRAFRYRDKGTLATIGRNAAVAQFGPLQFSGFPAWFLWLTVHIVLLIGFRNRLIVLINWAWNYFSYDRALRLITGSERQ